MRVHSVGLWEAATAPESPDDWQWRARRALSRFGPRVIPALIDALATSEDSALRCFAADALARLGPEARSAADALRHAADHDDDPAVRAAAAAALEAVEETEDSS
jgi:HEAT repeat protein